MPEDNAIAIHYGEINNVLEQLYKKLYRKLRANEVALSSNYNDWDSSERSLYLTIKQILQD